MIQSETTTKATGSCTCATIGCCRKLSKLQKVGTHYCEIFSKSKSTTTIRIIWNVRQERGTCLDAKNITEGVPMKLSMSTNVHMQNALNHMAAKAVSTCTSRTNTMEGTKRIVKRSPNLSSSPRPMALKSTKISTYKSIYRLALSRKPQSS